MHEPMVWKTDVAFLSLLLVGVMLLVAVGIGLQVYLRERPGAPARSFVSRLLSGLWALPVLAVAALLVARAVPSISGETQERPPTITAGNDLVSLDAHVVSTEEAAAEPAEYPEAVQEWLQYQVATEGEDESATAAFVVSSRQYATVEQADERARSAALDKLREHFHRLYGNQGDWSVPPRLVQDAIRRRHVESITHSTGNIDFEVYRVHAQVVVDPPLRTELHNVWRGQISQRRLWALGGLLGFATLLVGACAAYLRLDLLTQGEYRRRLKLATVALIAAGGLVAARLMPLG